MTSHGRFREKLTPTPSSICRSTPPLPSLPRPAQTGSRRGRDGYRLRVSSMSVVITLSCGCNRRSHEVKARAVSSGSRSGGTPLGGVRMCYAATLVALCGHAHNVFCRTDSTPIQTDTNTTLTSPTPPAPQLGIFQELTAPLLQASLRRAFAVSSQLAPGL